MPRSQVKDIRPRRIKTKKIHIFTVSTASEVVKKQIFNLTNNSHSYMLIDKLDYSIFEDDWNLMEEAQFIKGMFECGIDNWCNLSEHLHNVKNIKELYSHFYSFYYDILAIAENSGIYLDNFNKAKCKFEVTAKDAKKMMIDSLLIERNKDMPWNMYGSTKHNELSCVPKVIVNQEKYLMNKKKVENIKTRFHDEFMTVCSINRLDVVDSRVKPKKYPLNGRKNLTKILNYNPRRKEFEEELNEEVIAEINFSVPNYCVDQSAENNTKQNTRKRAKAEEEAHENIEAPSRVKMNSVHYYNNVLDRRQEQYKIISDWGLLGGEHNPMKDLIIQTDEDRDFVNVMKIFARFNKPKNHVNMINSLLLEKNIRILLQYLNQAKKEGKYDLDTLNEVSNKKIFKLLTSKMVDNIDNDESGLDGDDSELDYKKQNNDNKVQIYKELNRDSLRPSRCYGFSLSIPLCKGYNCLNELERVLVERMGIFPESFLKIKMKILELNSLEGRIEPPDSLNPKYQHFWYSLQKYVKLHPEVASKYQQAPNILSKFLYYLLSSIPITRLTSIGLLSEIYRGVVQV